MTELTVQNYFDPECRNITLELDKDKTPSENMQSYFKLYNKLKRTYSAVLQQTDQNNEEIAYFESVLDSLENCSSDADIDEIKAELAGGGYAGKKSGKQQKKKKTGPLRYTATDGTLIYVGKNNIQNDELTLKTAMPYDIWLHTKNIPGSHVIIKLDGKSASDQTITEAAKLACYHSKARGAVPTAVDYCQRKYVKKPAGAKPGKVIYDNYKTAYVSCDKEEAEKMLTKQ